jgi:hypothetical protein
MLCTAIVSAEISPETDNDKQKLGRAKDKISKPRAVSKAAKGRFENPKPLLRKTFVHLANVN